ncbi:nitrilase-related carbon-nitrogen hydrolase, partial [Vibrio parahaemolyticus]|nr:nitrilase-related carbon-nitrogen hydrolase [Vibrio parahaemolyticus]
MISFFSPYRHDLVRIAACVPQMEVANPGFNGERTLELLHQGHQERIALMVFPELGLSAYSIDDLFHQDALLESVEEAIGRLVADSADLFPAFVVGAPLRSRGRLYNAAIVIHAERILGVVPKAYLPNYREFYERRHFAPGAEVRGQTITVAGVEVPLGIDLLFRSTGSCPFTFHVEICEDMWVPHPPSTEAALGGAEILLNLSASNITIGKAEDRRLLCGSQSMRCIAAYAYSAAGPGESTTDLAWDGHGGIFEDGLRLAETERLPPGSTMAVADVDL